MEITIIQHPHGVTVLQTPNQVYTLDLPQRDPRLAGQTIRVSEAAQKYHISQPTLTRWAYRGLVHIINRAPRLLELDEGDVSYMAACYAALVPHTGARAAGHLLNELN